MYDHGTGPSGILIMSKSPQIPTPGLLYLWKLVPLVARLMVVGLGVISGLVIWDFLKLMARPGGLQPGEDLYLHIALLILVPGALMGMCFVSFGYAYYQWCKRFRQEPFWKRI